MYSKLSQTSKMELFVKTVKNFHKKLRLRRLTRFWTCLCSRMPLKAFILHSRFSFDEVSKSWIHQGGSDFVTYFDEACFAETFEEIPVSLVHLEHSQKSMMERFSQKNHNHRHTEKHLYSVYS